MRKDARPGIPGRRARCRTSPPFRTCLFPSVPRLAGTPVMIRNRLSSAVRPAHRGAAGGGGRVAGGGTRPRRNPAGGRVLPCAPGHTGSGAAPSALAFRAQRGPRAFVLPLLCALSPTARPPEATLSTLCSALVTVRPGHKSPEGYLFAGLRRHRGQESILSTNSL